MDPTITRRPITKQDEGFLYRVYASTRQEELARVPWDEAQKSTFLKMQFDAQHRYYLENYPRAKFQIILREGIPIGRLYVDRRKKEIRIIDIALLSEYRRQGIGSALLEEILEEGRRFHLPVTIHVEFFNPAMRLYDRLGFRKTSETGIYLKMEWTGLGSAVR
jgi:ribosomal protein S18 acetylase RimI-like enzyme